MKNLLLTTAVLVTIVITGLFINSCREDFQEVITGENNIPVLRLNVDSVSYSFVNATISLNYLPGFADSEYGICWDTLQQVTIKKNKATISEIKEPHYKIQANNFLPNTTYYLRGYFKTSDEVIYSNQKNITTLDARPVVSVITKVEVKAKFMKVSASVRAPNGFAISKRGVCLSITELPDLSDNFITSGSGNGVFTSELSNLEVDKKYYLRAYATNSGGTTFGEQLIVTTLDGLPHLTTTEITNVTATTATTGGDITDDGGDAITARGVCYSTSQTPTTDDSKTVDGTGTGNYASELAELDVNTTYYTRAYTTNSTGTVYGNEQTFTTLDGLPHLTTTAITKITATTATCGGDITDDGGFAITARGICYSTSSNPTTADNKTVDDTGTGSYVSELTDLAVNTTYFVRAYATNSTGTVYGNEQSFTTQDGLPQLTTNAITNITAITATAGGDITDDGGFAITARGICYSTSSNPTTTDNKTVDGAGTGSYVSELTDLAVNTTYFVRAYATNSTGTVYGNEQTFTTQDGLPHLTTAVITGITATSSTGGGNITSDGGDVIIARGICYSTSSNPTTADTKTVDGAGTGSYVSELTDLAVNTTYFVRAYATNSIGTVYGNEQTFTTKDGLPQITTDAITGITATTATSGGNITDDGGFAVISRGVCYSTSNNPTINDTKTTDGIGVGSWVSELAELTLNTTYYVRAYATNSIGTVYGSERAFTTKDGLPQLTTNTITDITATTATGGGNITDNGGFDITARGVCYSTSSNPTTADNKIVDGEGTGSYVSEIANLAINTTYFLRAYATNSAGTVYGSEQTFTTQDGLPMLTTVDVTNITGTTATTGGNITDDGGFAITDRGICYSITQNPTTANSKIVDHTGTDNFISKVTELTLNTTYYVRAYAINSIGTSYGDEKSFKTNIDITGETGTLTDYDGNTYGWVGIGNQAWMAENLKVTHYPNGTAIPYITDNTVWDNLGDNNTDDAYCFYNNNASLGYGALYTYSAAKEACPTGWHLPSDAEWKQLEIFLGMSESEANEINYRGTDEGTKLKATTGWVQDGNGTDDYGFAALPGGLRADTGGGFSAAGPYGYWWTNTEYFNGTLVWFRFLGYLNTEMGREGEYGNKSRGLSVRCLMD